MQDPVPIKKNDELKYWMTSDKDKKSLLEFNTKEAFRSKTPTKTYTLLHQLAGNAQAIYAGSFFYNQEGTNKLVKYDLTTEATAFINVFAAATKADNRALYTTQVNYMDINVDENGLWVIFASNVTNNTMILKFNPNTMQTEYVWNLTLDHQEIGEMFIICGVLYGIESVRERNTKINFAFDLYAKKPFDINVEFTNPFSQTNFISYNPHSEKIFTWDKGNLLEYPVRLNETIDLSIPDDDDEKS